MHRDAYDRMQEPDRDPKWGADDNEVLLSDLFYQEYVLDQACRSLSDLLRSPAGFFGAGYGPDLKIVRADLAEKQASLAVVRAEIAKAKQG